MLGLTGRTIIAEEAAAGIARAVAAIDVPGQRGGRRLVAFRVGADIKPAAPFGHAVIGERVGDDVERVPEQIDPAAMRAVGLGPFIAVDQVILDRHLVFV